jgi:hypothetical protein
MLNTSVNAYKAWMNKADTVFEDLHPASMADVKLGHRKISSG